MSNFIVSTDNCADFYKSYMNEKGIYCIPLRYIVEGQEFAEIYDTKEQFDSFYEEVIKKGLLPSTAQLNPQEVKEHFNKIFAENKKGDIIHVSISGGFSGTFNNAKLAAEEINKENAKKDIAQKVYVVDSLHVTGGIMMLVEKLLDLRKATPASKAVKIIEDIRDHQQIFFLLDDLHHLRRGGRIGTAKAIVGSLLGIKPILIVDNKGQVSFVHKVRGNRKGIDYLIEQMQAQADKPGKDYAGEEVWLIRTSESEFYNQLKQDVTGKYPKAIIKETQVGPVVGGHLGCGGIAVLFVGKPRLKG